MSQDSALSRFEKLIGKWEMTGRTLGATEDNITGWNVFEWLPGGHFLKSEGEINFKGSLMQSLEIIRYDAEHDDFPAIVYSSMSGELMHYQWDIQGDTLIHAGLGARYVGTFSQNDNVITGGWRPDDPAKAQDENNYDAIMTRIPEPK